MFYTGEKILSKLDVNRNKPEIFMVTDLRSTGKTTFFIRMLTNRYIKKREKFVCLVRFKYELDNIAASMYKDVGWLFFPKKSFSSTLKAGGLYASIQMNNEEIGYGLALNSYDTIKKKSHLFVDASSILFDEFQSESNHYVSNEITAIQSIHKSLSRGHGKMVKYLPVYMLSNHITLLNPYFTHFGLTNLHRDTHYYRGKGFVLEQLFNTSAIKEAEKSGFEQAFENTDYSQMTKQGKYLLDDNNYIESNHKISGRYVMTLIYNNVEYGIYDEYGKFYCGREVDKIFPIRYIIGRGASQNVELITKAPHIINMMRYSFSNGNIYFGDLSSKECIINALGY